MQKRTAVRIGVLVLVLLLLVGGGAGWLARIGLNPIAQRLLHSLAQNESAEWKVSATRVRGNLLTRVHIDSLRVTRRIPGEGEREVLSAARAVVAWEPAELLAGRLHITGIELDGGRISPGAVMGGAAVGAVPAAESRSRGGLPFVRPTLDRVRLRNVDLVGPGGPERLKLTNFNADLTQVPETGSWNLRLQGGVFERGGAELPLRSSVLRGGIEGGRFHLEELRLETERSRITAWLSGGTEGTGPLEGAVALQPLDTEDLAALGFAVDEIRNGTLAGRLALEGTRDDLLFHGDMSGDAAGLPSVAMQLGGSVRGGVLAFDRLHGTVGEGSVDGQGELALDATHSLRARFDFTGVRLGEVLRAHGLDRSARATGTLRVEDRPEETGGRRRDAALRLRGASLGDARFDGLNVDLSERNGAREFHFHVLSGADSVGGVLVERGDGGLDGHFIGRFADGSVLGRLAGRDDVALRGRADGVIAGTAGAPSIDLTGAVTGVRVAAVRGDTASVRLEWRPAAGEEADGEGPYRLAVVMSRAHLGSAPVDTVRLRLAGGLDQAAIPEAAVIRGAVRLVGRGEMTRVEKQTDIRLDEVAGETGLLHWRNEAPVRVTVVPGMTRVAPFVLDAGEAKLEGGGTVRGDSLDLDLALETLELRSLGEIESLGGRSAGQLALAADVHGTAAEPDGSARLTLDNAVIAGLSLPHVEIAAALGQGRARIEKGVVSTVGGDLQLEGSFTLRPEEGKEAGTASVRPGLGEPLRITTRDFRISSLHRAVPRLEPVEGRADLSLLLESWGSNPSVRFEGEARELEIAGQPVGVARFHGSLRDSLLRLDVLEVDGGSGRAEATGRMRVAFDRASGRPVRLPGPFALSVTVPQGDLSVVPLLVPNAEEAKGTFEGEILIEGDENAVHTTGRATTQDAELVLVGLKDHYRKVRGSFTLLDSLITLENVEGRQGEEGKVRLSGTAILQGFEVTDYDLQLKLSRYEPLFWRDVTGKVDGRFRMRPVTLTSGRVVPHMEGELQVEELLVRRRLEAQPAGEGAEAGPIVPPEATFAFKVTADNNVLIQNEDVRMELQGEIFTEFDEKGLVLLGELQSIRGQYYLYNHKFNIDHGVFTFSDIANLDNVKLDVHAETRVQGEKVEVTLSGTLREPDITTVSESGLSDTDIFRLLTLGYTPESQGSAGGGSFFVESFARAWSEKLGGQIASGIGIDELAITPGQNGVESTRLEVGKRITPDAYLNFQYAFRGAPGEQQQLADWRLQNPERLLSLEYHLTDWFLLDGEAGTLQGNEFLNLDLKFRWSY